MSNKFRLNKSDAKLMGVCAGMADYTGWDVTLIRIGLVLLTITTSGLFALAYLVAGMIAE